MRTVKSIPGQSDLRELINILLISYQPVAEEQKSTFINEIPEDLPVLARKEILTSLLSSLFYIIARCSRETRIRINAKCFHDVMVLHIKDSSSNDSYRILSEFEHLRIFAQQIAGSLEITSQRNKETTIAFSFVNSVGKPAIFMETEETEQLKCA